MRLPVLQLCADWVDNVMVSDGVSYIAGVCTCIVPLISIISADLVMVFVLS